MAIRIFGIRHHGPGSARSLLAALKKFKPDLVVVEGPPEAEEVLPLARHKEMRPPIALLVYPPDEPARASFYPFAEFSPEWQAFRYALERKTPIRLMDLPRRHAIALAKENEAAAEAEPPVDKESNGLPDLREDPFTLLARAAGHLDPELWWEEQVERRYDPSGIFEAILEAMRALREQADLPISDDPLREAYMRRTLREARKDGFERIAVVCGAWHGPALEDDALDDKVDGCRVRDDEAALKNLPKVKVTATWIPWTHQRLTFRSGYRSGVYSPGWYAHLWSNPQQAPMRWIALAARLLRDADLDASSASVIEAVRMADALAALRDRPSAGLTELNEAMLTVLCHGEPAPLELIRNKLEIGDILGEVPRETPSVPLAEDLAALQRSLRLKPTTEIKTLDIDLREENGLARSQLLHRLILLSIPWGQPASTSGGVKSTFHEIWRLQWQPEFALQVIEASVWGNTVESAATAATVRAADEATELAAITELLDKSILAVLPVAVDHLLVRLQERAAVSADVGHLMDALPPLARVARYGDVRQTRADEILPVFNGMFERVVVGLPAACSSLDEDAATRMVRSMAGVQASLDMLDRPDLRADWHAVLRRLLEGQVHGLLRGWCCRLLLESGVLSQDDLHTATRLALSPVVPPLDAASWIQGLLRGSGQVLLHQDGVWQVLDTWLRELPGPVFVELLPLLRRAFSDFQPAERRAMGEKVKDLRPGAGVGPRSMALAEQIDPRRADLVLPVLAQILGVSTDGRG